MVREIFKILRPNNCFNCLAKARSLRTDFLIRADLVQIAKIFQPLEPTMDYSHSHLGRRDFIFPIFTSNFFGKKIWFLHLVEDTKLHLQGILDKIEFNFANTHDFTLDLRSETSESSLEIFRKLFLQLAKSNNKRLCIDQDFQLILLLLRIFFLWLRIYCLAESVDQHYKLFAEFIELINCLGPALSP